MLGPRDRENPMRETTAYRAISISSHMVGIPGHCETECDFKMRNDEIVYASRIPPRHLEASRLGGLDVRRLGDLET